MKQTKTIKPNYKKTPVGIIPENWEVKRLEEVIIVLGGNAFKSLDTVSFGTKWLKIANVGKDEIKTDVIEYLPSTFEDKFRRFILRKDDYVMALTRPLLERQLKIAQIKQDTTWLLNQRVAKLSCHKSENYIDYFINILKQPFYCYQLEILMAGTDPPNLSLAEFKMINLPIPPLPEQKAIADCLSTWDRAIEKQTQLINAKKEFKKGLMQGFFDGSLSVVRAALREPCSLSRIEVQGTNALEAMPEGLEGGAVIIKAKEGEDFTEDWEEVRLKDISTKKSSSIQANLIIEDSGEYNVYGATGFLTKVDFYDEEENYIGIVKDGSGVGNMQFLEGKSSVLGTLDKIFSKKTNLYFLFCLLKRIDFEKYRVGGAIPHIYYKDYSKEKVLCPDIGLQTAIAQVLQSADKEIELLEKKLEQLKVQKKGLMQVLLTGEKRLV